MNTLGYTVGNDRIYFSQSPAQRINSNTLNQVGGGVAAPGNPYGNPSLTKMTQLSLSNLSKPTASFGAHQLSSAQQQLSAKTGDSLYNLNQGRISYPVAVTSGNLITDDALLTHQGGSLTGRLTQANESDGGTDQEFAMDDLQQPDATFAPGNGGAQHTDRSKQSVSMKS